MRKNRTNKTSLRADWYDSLPHVGSHLLQLRLRPEDEVVCVGEVEHVHTQHQRERSLLPDGEPSGTLVDRHLLLGAKAEGKGDHSVVFQTTESSVSVVQKRFRFIFMVFYD